MRTSPYPQAWVGTIQAIIEAGKAGELQGRVERGERGRDTHRGDRNDTHRDSGRDGREGRDDNRGHRSHRDERVTRSHRDDRGGHRTDRGGGGGGGGSAPVRVLDPNAPCDYDVRVGWQPGPADRLEPGKVKRLRGSLKVFSDGSDSPQGHDRRRGALGAYVTKRFFEMVSDDCTLRRYGSKEDYGAGMLPQHVVPIGAVSWVAELDHPDSPFCIVVHFDNDCEIKLLAHDADDREAWIQAFSDAVAKVEEAGASEKAAEEKAAAAGLAPPPQPGPAPVALTSKNRLKTGLLSSQAVTVRSKQRAKAAIKLAGQEGRPPPSMANAIPFVKRFFVICAEDATLRRYLSEDDAGDNASLPAKPSVYRFGDMFDVYRDSGTRLRVHVRAGTLDGSTRRADEGEDPADHASRLARDAPEDDDILVLQAPSVAERETWLQAIGSVIRRNGGRRGEKRGKKAAPAPADAPAEAPEEEEDEEAEEDTSPAGLQDKKDDLAAGYAVNDKLASWLFMPKSQAELAKMRRGPLRLWRGGHGAWVEKYFLLCAEDATLRRYGSKREFQNGRKPEHAYSLLAIDEIGTAAAHGSSWAMNFAFHDGVAMALAADSPEDRDGWLKEILGCMPEDTKEFDPKPFKNYALPTGLSPANVLARALAIRVPKVPALQWPKGHTGAIPRYMRRHFVLPLSESGSWGRNPGPSLLRYYLPSDVGRVTEGERAPIVYAGADISEVTRVGPSSLQIVFKEGTFLPAVVKGSGKPYILEMDAFTPAGRDAFVDALRASVKASPAKAEPLPPPAALPKPAAGMAALQRFTSSLPVAPPAEAPDTKNLSFAERQKLFAAKASAAPPPLPPGGGRISPASRRISGPAPAAPVVVDPVQAELEAYRAEQATKVSVAVAEAQGRAIEAAVLALDTSAETMLQAHSHWFTDEGMREAADAGVDLHSLLEDESAAASSHAAARARLDVLQGLSTGFVNDIRVAGLERKGEPMRRRLVLGGADKKLAAAKEKAAAASAAADAAKAASAAAPADGKARLDVETKAEDVRKATKEVTDAVAALGRATQRADVDSAKMSIRVEILQEGLVAAQELAGEARGEEEVARGILLEAQRARAEGVRRIAGVTGKTYGDMTAPGDVLPPPPEAVHPPLEDEGTQTDATPLAVDDEAAAAAAAAAAAEAAAANAAAAAEAAEAEKAAAAAAEAAAAPPPPPPPAAPAPAPAPEAPPAPAEDEVAAASLIQRSFKRQATVKAAREQRKELAETRAREAAEAAARKKAEEEAAAAKAEADAKAQAAADAKAKADAEAAAAAAAAAAAKAQAEAEAKAAADAEAAAAAAEAARVKAEADAAAAAVRAAEEAARLAAEAEAARIRAEAEAARLAAEAEARRKAEEEAARRRAEEEAEAARLRALAEEAERKRRAELEAQASAAATAAMAEASARVNAVAAAIAAERGAPVTGEPIEVITVDGPMATAASLAPPSSSPVKSAIAAPYSPQKDAHTPGPAGGLRDSGSQEDPLAPPQQQHPQYQHSQYQQQHPQNSSQAQHDPLPPPRYGASATNFWQVPQTRGVGGGAPVPDRVIVRRGTGPDGTGYTVLCGGRTYVPDDRSLESGVLVEAPPAPEPRKLLRIANWGLVSAPIRSRLLSAGVARVGLPSGLQLEVDIGMLHSMEPVTAAVLSTDEAMQREFGPPPSAASHEVSIKSAAFRSWAESFMSRVEDSMKRLHMEAAATSAAVRAPPFGGSGLLGTVRPLGLALEAASPSSATAAVDAAGVTNAAASASLLRKPAGGSYNWVGSE